MLHILLCSYFLVKDYVDRILQPVFTALSVFPTITQQTVEIYADHIIVIIAIITTTTITITILIIILILVLIITILVVAIVIVIAILVSSE